MAMKPPVDGVIKNASMLYMLDPKVACPLAIANHENMRLAFIFNPSFKTGCRMLGENERPPVRKPS